MSLRILPLLASATLLFGLAHAQTPGVYAGASTGVVALGELTGFPFAGHVGFEDVGIDDLDVRVGAVGYLAGGFEGFADVLYGFPTVTRTQVYVGGGPRLIGVEDGGIAGFGVSGGVTYALDGPIEAFAEGGQNTYVFGPLSISLGVVRVGLNIHLD